MATVNQLASQVVFHPVVSQTLKIGSTTLGRDKCYRALQYFARFYSWYLSNNGDKLAVARWNALKSHLATARKLLRLGKPIEHLRSALTIDPTAPLPENITAIARQLGYFGFLSLDAFVWANAIKFYSLSHDTAQKVSKISNRFWVVAIMFSLVHGGLKTTRLTKEISSLRPTGREKDLGHEVDREMKLRTMQGARSNTLHQLVIDSLDVWIPATSLGYSTLNDGWLGIFGLITSVMALQKQWASVNSKK